MNKNKINIQIKIFFFLIYLFSNNITFFYKNTSEHSWDNKIPKRAGLDLIRLNKLKSLRKNIKAGKIKNIILKNSNEICHNFSNFLFESYDLVYAMDQNKHNT